RLRPREAGPRRRRPRPRSGRGVALHAPPPPRARVGRRDAAGQLRRPDPRVVPGARPRRPVKAGLAQRVLAVAAVTALRAAAALAIADRSSGSERPRQTLPQAVGMPGGGWYSALAGVRSKPPPHHRSACGYLVGPKTLGVGHPVLSCGAKLYLAFGE